MATANELNISQPGLVAFDGTATFTGRTLQEGAGITITNGDGISGDPIIALTGGSEAIEHLTGDSGGQLDPDGSNNFNLIGQTAGSVTVFDTIGSGSTISFEDRAWLTQLVVDPSSTVGLRGTFSTITAALAAASSGQTIFVRPGTYTEDLTLKAGVNIAAFTGDSSLATNASQFNVKVVGKLTATFSGTCEIGNICIQTNSDYAFVLSGASSPQVVLNSCFILGSDNTIISITGTGAILRLNYCFGDLQTTGIAFFTCTAGSVLAFYSNLVNQASSSTASTLDNANFQAVSCTFNSFVSTTNASSVNIRFSRMGSGNNTTIALTGTSALSADFCQLVSGTASAISVGAGCTASVYDCEVSSSNANAITGAGSIDYAGITFSSSSSTVNTTTQTTHALTERQGGTGQTSYVSGDTLYASATNTLSKLAKGSDGQVLTLASGLPSWATPATNTPTTTFTPVLNFGGATTGITYTIQLGRYSQAGNIVTFSIEILLSNKGSATGSATITGLPVTSAATIKQGFVPGYWSNITLTALYTGLSAYVGAASTTLNLSITGSGQTASTALDSMFANTSYIIMNGSYVV